MRILFLLASLAGLGALTLTPGCSASCTSDCSHQYDDCMKTATGAQHADCSTAYDRCVAGCSD